MITEAQEANLSNQMARTRQDAKTPFCIHVKDGRLMPNVKEIREHADYRPYKGNYKASHEERMAYLRSGGFGGAPAQRQVILPVEDIEPVVEQEPFDISKASKDELVAFAFDQWAEVLDPATHLTTLRSQVVKLAKANAQAAADPLG
jgi:hypothetical protein